MNIGYTNVGDAIIKTLLTTDYTKRRVNYLLLFCITLIIRSIVNSILCFFFATGIWIVDFTVQTSLGIFMVLHTDAFYYHVCKYKEDSLCLSQYLVDNYTPENFRLWKKYVVLATSSYLILFFWMIPINSAMIIEYIIQFLICYLIVDNIENRNGVLFDIFDKVQEKRHVKIHKKEDIVIIEDYKVDTEKRDDINDFFIFDEGEEK